MARDAIALEIDDVSAFARALRSALGQEPALPGHQGFLNHVARAAGFRNYQHLKTRGAAEPAAPVDPRRLAAVLRCFDQAGRMARWPGRTSLQETALWALWSRLPGRAELTEPEVNALIDRWHLFGDRALLRRSLVAHGLARRNPDGSGFRRIEAAPPAEARALLRALAGRDPAGQEG